MNWYIRTYGFRLWALLIAMPLLWSCSMADDTDCPEVRETANYINLTLYVRSDQVTTRSPNGGEDGDGREAGFERENEVKGITLILYKGSGLNDPKAKVDFVRYFKVTEDNLEGRDPQGTVYNYQAAETYRAEARYTTGDQKVGTDEIDFKGVYHVLIVANQDVSGECPKGTPISTVRDLAFDNVYSIADDDKEKPWIAQQFVMSTERDATINFGGMAPVEKTGMENALVYRVLQPMLIERLSARIDYNTKGSEYSESRGGYEYSVGSTGDKFVITKITPFNLYKEQEYLFKRVQDAWPANVTTYLGDETTTNYVVDPKTGDKDNVKTLELGYLNPIGTVNDALSANNSTGSTNYTQVLSVVKSTSTFTDDAGNENVIIAYPKENTLMPTSQLMRYATGIAFQGDYYNAGSTTPDGHRIYYYFLRHQGESPSGTYMAKPYTDLETENPTCGDVPMNFGIVRNNIYRVDVAGFTEEGEIIIHIKVKKWDRFEHATIYM